MSKQDMVIPCRAVGEWMLWGRGAHDNPFADVAVDVTFTSPSGKVHVMPAFYDGDGAWRVRYRPGEAGTWTYTSSSRPADPGLSDEGTFMVTPNERRGFIVATPGEAWGFRYESGEPAFLLGDTTYNLFGMAHCGGDVEAFLRRRAEQGFNVFRVRLQVSPFHPPNAHSAWQTRRTWPWGGSEQSPRFDRFNLDYFATVDRVVQLGDELGIGFEMILEAWGFEFPFGRRDVFVPEWEELWLRYLIARYDAYSSVYFWTLMNEYEYYPNGDWRYSPLADRWAMRVGRWVKGTAPHGHVVSVHNGPRMPPFAERFRMDPGAIDAIMFQAWGTTGEEDGWLAAGIDEQITKSLSGWSGSAAFAEYGYERNPGLPLTFPGFTHCDGNHTRRGAWRGAFCAMGVLNGFENTWGPVMNLQEDQEGVAYLQHVKVFFAQVAPFELLRPAGELVLPGQYEHGHTPLALASEGRDLVVVYLPAGGTVRLDLAGNKEYSAQWYDPRTGALSSAAAHTEAPFHFGAPGGADEHGHPWDWVLLLRS